MPQLQTIVNNKNCPILFNFVLFTNAQFQFHFCDRFSTPVHNFDLGLLQFRNQSEFAKFQYWSYLLATLHALSTLVGETQGGIVFIGVLRPMVVKVTQVHTGPDN